jgi:excisionase family DNA binding protein
MKIYKITETSEYLGVSINTLKTLANNKKIKSFKTSGSHRRFRQDEAEERRKIRLKMNLTNLMEFEKEVL